MNRFCTLLVTALSLPAFAGLTETDVVNAGLNNPLIKTRLEAQLNAARGEKQVAGKWDNPTIEYNRESLDLPEGTSEESSIWIKQKINVAGVKGLEREAADFNLQSQQHRVELKKQDWQRLLRQDFYITLAAENKQLVVEQMLSRLRSISTMVTQRANKGDASRFDAMRIDKELALILSQSTRAKTKALNHSAKLFSLLDIPAQKLSGRLMPKPNTYVSTNERIRSNKHPQLQALHSAQMSAEADAKAAGREAWPELTLSIGRKELNEPDLVADGNTFSIGIEVPLFGHSYGKKQVALSRARELKAELTLLQKELQVEYDTTLNRYHNYQKTTLEMEKLTMTKQATLSQLAETSYRAGELTVMELLDAYQSDLAVTEQYIDSALAARLAYIELQFLGGK